MDGVLGVTALLAASALAGVGRMDAEHAHAPSTEV
jgi:hypothetical protein